MAALEQDPAVTDKGVAESKEAGKQLATAGKKFEVILSSSQLRTTETGMYMFPGQKVYQVYDIMLVVHSKVRIYV